MVRSRWFVAFVVVLLVITGAGRAPLRSAGGSSQGDASRWEPGGGRIALVAIRQADTGSDGGALVEPVAATAPRGRDLVPTRAWGWRLLPELPASAPIRLRHELSERWARAPPRA